MAAHVIAFIGQVEAEQSRNKEPQHTSLRSPPFHAAAAPFRKVGRGDRGVGQKGTSSSSTGGPRSIIFSSGFTVSPDAPAPFSTFQALTSVYQFPLYSRL